MCDGVFLEKGLEISSVSNNETIVTGEMLEIALEMFRAKARPKNICFNRPDLGPRILGCLCVCVNV